MLIINSVQLPVQVLLQTFGQGDGSIFFAFSVVDGEDAFLKVQTVYTQGQTLKQA